MCSSLLAKLRLQDAEAWNRLVRLYYPLVRGWCQKAGARPEDAADVAQEVFRALAGNVSRFDRANGQNSFRSWLRGITRRQMLAHWRRQKNRPVAIGGSDARKYLAESPEAEESSVEMDAGERHELLHRALQLMRDAVAEHTWQAFWLTTVDGQSPADVAAELGMSVNAVYVSKARVLARLRTEFGELID
jgi:RNA polymerase sigma-70 factor (ECF subfamily)